MRKLLLSSVVLIFSLAPHLAGAGPRSVQVEPAPAVPQGFESYRGYVFDLSENSDRKDVDAISELLRHQLDVVETVGLSPKVLQFFHTVPIIASEMACLDEGARDRLLWLQRTSERRVGVAHLHDLGRSKAALE